MDTIFVQTPVSELGVFAFQNVVAVMACVVAILAIIAGVWMTRRQLQVSTRQQWILGLKTTMSQYVAALEGLVRHEESEDTYSSPHLEVLQRNRVSLQLYLEKSNPLHQELDEHLDMLDLGLGCMDTAEERKKCLVDHKESIIDRINAIINEMREKDKLMY